MTAPSRRRERLGSRAVAFLESGTGNVREATCEWDSSPPLSVADESYYLVIVLPALTKRAQEYLERPERALVLIT